VTRPGSRVICPGTLPSTSAGADGLMEATSNAGLAFCPQTAVAVARQDKTCADRLHTTLLVDDDPAERFGLPAAVHLKSRPADTAETARRAAL
jgi:hypothetical protein